MFDKLSVDKKFEAIDKLKESTNLDDNDWMMLSVLSNDESQEIRLEVSEVLALFPTIESEKILLNLLNDSDYLVRASACDSLYFSLSQETLKKLKLMTKDSRYLVRGYAVLSIGDVQKNVKVNKKSTIAFLKTLETEEKSRWVEIAVYRSLFILEEVSYIDKLICAINDTNYKNRSFALSLIEQLLDDNVLFDFNMLKQTAQNRLAIEKNLPIKQKLYEVIKSAECHIKNNTDKSLCAENYN